MISALILLFLLIVGLVYLGAKLHALLDRYRSNQLRAGQQAAAEAIESEYRQARQAMNKAAGQLWRNLVD